MKLTNNLQPASVLDYTENAEDEETYKLIEELGFLEFPSSGIPKFSNPGQRVMNNIEREVRDSLSKFCFNEVRYPTLQDPSIYKKSGRHEKFSDEFFEASEEKIIAPTQEEAFLEEVEERLLTEKHLPISLFEVTYKFRDCGAEKGIMRNKEFLMADAFSLHKNEDSLYNTIGNFEEAVFDIGDRLNIGVEKVEKTSDYVDYVVETDDGYIETDSGNLSSSIAMYYIDDGNILEDYSFKTDEDPILCSYGIGISRLFHGVVEENKYSDGIDFPESIKPYDLSLIPVFPDEKTHIDYCDDLYQKLRESGINVLYDDRKRRGIRQKEEQHLYYGVEDSILVGDNEIEKNVLTLSTKEEESKTSLNKIIQEFNKIKGRSK